MMTKKVVAFLVLGCMSVLQGCTSRIVVSRLSRPDEDPKPNSAHGVVYALPRTVIQAQVPLVKTTYKPGPFCACTPEFFPEEDFDLKTCQSKPVTYRVEPPTLGVRGEPDPRQVFLYRVEGGRFEDRTTALTFTDNGVLTDGDAESKSTVTEFTGKLIGTLASLAGKVAAGDEPVCSDARKAQASVAASDIRQLERERDSLVRNLAQHPIEAASLNAALQRYEDWIRQRKQRLFTGVKKDELIWKGNFELLPPGSLPSPRDFALFAYSNTKGVCKDPAADEVSSLEPYPEETVDCAGADHLVVSVHVDRPANQLADNISWEEKTGELYGFRFRIPAKAVASVRATGWDEKSKTARVVQLLRGEFLIAQLGAIVALPASTNGRQSNYALSLNPVTGALKNFKLGSKALMDSSALGDLGTAANAAIDAHLKQKEKKEKAEDELNQLERQRKILEEKVKIMEAEEKLKKP